MRTKVTLVLVFLNVALFFFIFKFERHWRTERALLETRKRVLGAEAADIRALEVVNTAGGSFSFEKRGDTWWLTKPLEWIANPPAVERIKNELLFLEHVTSFNVRDLAKNDQSLADYGLDKPKLTVTFRSGDSSTGNAISATLAIGDSTKAGNSLYVLSPDGERIHVVSRTLLESLTLPLEQLRSDSLLTIKVYEARALILQPAAPAVRTFLRRDSNRWVFETPVNARASKVAVDLTINDLNSLHVESFVPPSPTAPRPVDSPALRITLEGNSRRETLLLGAPAPVRPGRAPGETEYYAQFEDRMSSPRAALFTVVIPAKLKERLDNAPEKLRDQHILDFDPAAVTSITLSSPQQQSEIVLQRLEAPPTTAGAPNAALTPVVAWQVVRRGGDAAGSQPIPADSAAVQRVLEQLAQFSAQRFLTESATSTDVENWGFNRPEREISLTLPGPPATIASVQIGLATPRDKFAYARLGPAANPSPSVYLVDPSILDETVPVPSAWRARLLRDLPVTTRITGLKVVDLSTTQTLVDTTFDANGAPVAPVRDPAAVQAVLPFLRTLRAKRFTQEGFSDRVMTAGEERPWRYELTAAISLPGGTGGEQMTTSTLLLTERAGGTQQLAGSREFNAVFEIEQPFLDALWTLIYGPRDPGPPANEQKK